MSNSKIYYAPWRSEYYKQSKDSRKKSEDPKTCVFCDLSDNHIILKTKYTYLIANKYPYAGGHVLVLPKRHVSKLSELTTKERTDLFNIIDLATYTLDVMYSPDGYNIGCSVGKVSGGSVYHLHFHVLPRFEGDVGWNMVCGFTVLSLTPDELAKKMIENINKKKIKLKFGIK
jgi:ATP adenylyltransferase